MSADNDKPNWFACVSGEVKCMNCKHWEPLTAHELGKGESGGKCHEIPVFRGVWNWSVTQEDMFCSEFEIKDNV